MDAGGVPTLAVVGPRRVIADPARWFSEGSHLKSIARRTRECVECRRGLATSRTPYCSRTCQWKFCGRYFWDSARTYVLHRDRFTCQHCRRRFRVRFLEVDHIREIARGGASLEYGNLQTLCKSCHRDKTAEFLRGRSVRATDPWRECRAPGAAIAYEGDPQDWFPA